MLDVVFVVALTPGALYAVEEVAVYGGGEISWVTTTTLPLPSVVKPAGKEVVALSADSVVAAASAESVSVIEEEAADSVSDAAAVSDESDVEAVDSAESVTEAVASIESIGCLKDER